MCERVSTMMEEKELLLGDIRQLWNRIRPALDQIKAEQNTDWIPEDIYHWVMAGQATLYATDDGFAIVQRGQNEVTGEIFLRLLICYSWDGTQNIKDYMAAFENLARSVRASYMEVLSNRRGFERVGFEIGHIVYKRRV